MNKVICNSPDWLTDFQKGILFWFFKYLNITLIYLIEWYWRDLVFLTSQIFMTMTFTHINRSDPGTGDKSRYSLTLVGQGCTYKTTCSWTFAFLRCQLRVAAFDSAFPQMKALEDVLISVTRNPNSPRFGRNTYSTRITENFPVGDQVLQLTATDKDGVSNALLDLQRAL